LLKLVHLHWATINASSRNGYKFDYQFPRYMQIYVREFQEQDCNIEIDGKIIKYHYTFDADDCVILDTMLNFC